ncbi:hypothetical protein [Thiocapsa sp.]|uniref:hypothetical protein n=1 Tax=Thiocapsa sp. TaxID=2024551 RepID=UPI0035942CA8
MPPNGFFTPGNVFPCRLRHSSVSFLDDAALVVRGASLKFADEAVDSPFDMLMNNDNSTPFWNMDTFFQFTLARIRGGRADLIDYFKRNPRCYMNVRDALRRDPSSFANLRYYSQIPLRFIAEDAVERYAKFRLIPWDKTREGDGIPGEADLQAPWYRLRGQPPSIPDERNDTTDTYADETVSTVESDDVYMRPCLPRRDTPERREERRQQLEQARGVYQSLHGYIETEPTGGQPPWQPSP